MADDVSSEIPLMDESIKDTNANNLSPADLLELKSILNDELKTLEVARISAQLEENTSSITELQTSITELKEKLVEESDKLSLQELIIKRLQMQEILCSVLFNEKKDLRDSKITTNSLEELPLASEIMVIQKDVGGLQNTYDELKLDNLKLKHENMAIMERLKNHKGKAHSTSAQVTNDKEYRVLKKELDVRNKSLEILKNIIPRLVVGAGMSDQHLQELVLQCGEPVNL